MRLFLSTITLLCIITTLAQAQFTEGFNSSNKGSYVAGTTTLPSGNWFMSEALMGNLSADLRFGSHSVRMRDALPAEGTRIQMQFDVEGAGQVRFYYGTYATDANAGRHSAIKLQQSIDAGSTWTDIGSPLTSTADFQLAVFDVDYEFDIRFRIVKISGNTTSHRVNIDDFSVTEYIEPFQNARISLSIPGQDLSDLNNITYAFPGSMVNESVNVTITIQNTGQDALNGSTRITGSPFFTLHSDSLFNLDYRESQNFTVTLNADQSGNHAAEFIIDSNDLDTPQISISLTSNVIAAGNVIPISAARELPFGTIVTIAGWVSTADEFGGPIFMQDSTAGIAVFHNPIHSAVQRGDSVVVTGPLSEFNPISGTPGTFLRQITGSSVQFSVHPEGFQFVEPRIITFQQMNSGCCEGELVLVEDVEFSNVGVFPSNTTNYTVSQYGETALVRIDTRSNFTGSIIPVGPTNVVGVVDRFNSIYQLKPRDISDLGVEEMEIPWSDIPLSETFDVGTWNIEWFGSPNNGPSNVELQFNNVRRVIETMDLDLYALQEIANVSLFHRLVDSLSNYNGFVSNYSQTQKVAYLYKTSVIDSISSDYVATGSTWAGGRFPFMFEFDATIGNSTKRIKSINFHAKAFANQSDYNQRVADAAVLKMYTDARTIQQEKLIVLGDYNDDVTTSTWNNATSPYQSFVTDPRYEIVTKSLSEMGFTSYRSVSMIDHIMMNEHLFEYHLSGSQQVENVSYIGSYLSTTSDHYPVWTRFQFEQDPVSINDLELEIPQRVHLHQNYPNPFNPGTTITFELPQSDVVTLKVYDGTGRLVSILHQQSTLNAGTHHSRFDASHLTSGVYLYRLTTSSGVRISNKMLLIK
jgi:endonuclease/exonuclease/phosphatase family metal-dependent hydrolase